MASQLCRKRSETFLDVLIVGCGCSGTLTAKYFRDMLQKQALLWDRLPKQARSKQICFQDHVNLTLWDWARGPAGRMATFQIRTADSRSIRIADIGAQVLSARSPSDEEHLRSHGAIDAFGLAATTCERPPDAYHFWMPGGLTDLLSKQIQHSLPDEVKFNRRVLSILSHKQHFVVEAECDSPPHWLARGRFSTGRYQPEHGQKVIKKVFDAVVLATTASDALSVHGMSGALGPSNVAALQSISYDSRLSLTFILSSRLRDSLETFFANGLSEVDLECGSIRCSQGVLGLLAWQDRKGRCNDDCTVIVAHSTRTFARDNLVEARHFRQTPEEYGRTSILQALALQLNISEPFLRESIIYEKALHWHQGQARRFLTGLGDCLRIPAYKTKVPGPFLVLCGDYFTEANFSGCSRSAHATASALMNWLHTRLVV